MAKYKEGFCQICGCEPEAYVSAYRERPFVDGRKYKEICWCCANVPKTWELLKNYDDGYCIHKEYVMVYDEMDPKRLHTVEEIMSEGWDREEATRSVRAVKRAIKNSPQKGK